LSINGRVLPLKYGLTRSWHPGFLPYSSYGQLSLLFLEIILANKKKTPKLLSTMAGNAIPEGVNFNILTRRCPWTYSTFMFLQKASDTLNSLRTLTRAYFHLFERRRRKSSGGVQAAPLSEHWQGLGL
jgi:hypothetical protein